MNKKCLDQIKAIIDADDYAEFEKLAETGDSKGWLAKVDSLVTGLDEKRVQLVRNVGVQNELFSWHNARVAEDPTLLKLQEKYAAKPSKRTLKKIEKRKLKVTNQSVKALVDDSGWVPNAGTSSLYKDELAQYHILVGKLSKALLRNPKVHGAISKKINDVDKRNIANAVFSGNQTTTKGASEIAAAINETGTYTVKKLNSLGMPITKLDNYGLAQTYDSVKVYRMGKEKFIELLGNDEQFTIRDNPAIKNPRYKPSENKELFLGEMWENITRGKGPEVDIAQPTSARGKSMINRTQFRYVQPKDGDVWYDTATLIGKHNDPIQAANDAMFHQAAQIAALEKFGSNPAQMWDDLIASLEKSLGGAKLSATAKRSFDNMVRPEGEEMGKVGSALKNYRDFEAQSLLGSATVAALSDLAFSFNEAWLHGLNPISVLTRHMGNLFTSGSTDLAKEVAVIVPNILQKAGQDHRLAEAGGNGAFQKMTQTMLTASGLNRWTDSSKAAFGLEFLKETAKVVKGGKLNKRLAAAFERYGITAEDLARMNDPKFMVKEGGVDFINPTALEAMDMETGRVMKNFMSMAIELTHASTPEPGIRMRSILTFGTKSGTIGHEVLKTLTQFMTFPLSTAIRTFSRMTDNSLTIGSRLSYTASLMLGTTALGGMVVQAKSLLKGEGTVDMTSPSFFTKAIMQGGGLGLFADFVLGGKIVPTAPLERRLTATWDLFAKALSKEEFSEKAEQFWHDLKGYGLDLGEDMTGFVTNLWWTKLLWDRTIMNMAERLFDPEYDNKVQRLNNKMYKANPGPQASPLKGGQGQWIKGDTIPEFMDSLTK